ncbi:MAG: (2Fe-2S) ferredoxin domain-containing protein [Clostridiaceae bacterium]
MITIEVCVGSACHLKGSYNVINKLQDLVKSNKLDDKVLIKAAFCLGNCVNGVSVRIDEGLVYSVSDENAEEFFQENVIKRL